MAAEDDSLERAAAARREGLRSLRAAVELLNTRDEDSEQVEDKKDIPDGDSVQVEDKKDIPDGDSVQVDDKDDQKENEEMNFNMKFRNYVPHDKQLQDGKVAPPVLPKFEDPVAAVAPPPENKEDPFVNIASKKPNWDLRRDVQKRLDKLERRTQKAMYKLMEEQEKQKELAELEANE